MFEPIGGTRKLKYPLYNSISNGNITDDAGQALNEFIWPEDPEERTILPLFVSQREFTAILSAMDVGADIAYPEQYIEVMWLMVRNLRYGVDICAMIAACINDNPETRQAIKDLVMSDDDISDYFTQIVEGLTTEQIIGPLIAGSCDDSVLAGKMMAMVERLDTNNKDALEIIEVGTNDEEKVAAVLEGIPVMGELPFGDILDFAQDVLEDFQENYDAASTTERKEAMARDLWCLALEKPDCVLTYADLFEFFQNRVSSGLTLESLVGNIVDWLKTGDFSTDDLVFNGMMAAQIAFVRVGKEFFGINLPKIGALTRDALPSSIWEEWEPCVEPVGDCLDFAEGQQGWNTIVGRGIYYPGQGLGPLGAPDGYVFYWGGPAPYEGDSNEIVMHTSVASTGWRLLSGVGNEIARYEGDATTVISFNEANAAEGYWPFPNVSGYRLIPIDESAEAGFILEELCFFPA